MRKKSVWTLFCVLAAAGCARTASTDQKEASVQYFESWASVNCPGAPKTALGSYVIKSEDGTGEAIGNAQYVSVDYIIRSLDGKVTASTTEQMAKQLGTYSEADTYVPGIWYRGDNVLYAGIDELLTGKHVGLKVKAAVPGWLMTSNRYSTAKEYQTNESGNDAIYEFHIVDIFDDVRKWETDSLVSYLKHNFPGVNPADTVDISDTVDHKKYGFYYIVTKPTSRPDSTFATDSKVYVNYIGRLLNGKVFDTNVKDTAKIHGIYKPNGNYIPSLINWKEKYEDLTMSTSGSDVIDGFKYALFQMKPYECGTAIFISDYGYSSNGSGATIPGYSPLRFDFELVDKE